MAAMESYPHDKQILSCGYGFSSMVKNGVQINKAPQTKDVILQLRCIQTIYHCLFFILPFYTQFIPAWVPYIVKLLFEFHKHVLDYLYLVALD